MAWGDKNLLGKRSGIQDLGPLGGTVSPPPSFAWSAAFRVGWTRKLTRDVKRIPPWEALDRGWKDVIDTFPADVEL